MTLLQFYTAYLLYFRLFKLLIRIFDRSDKGVLLLQDGSRNACRVGGGGGGGVCGWASRP